MTGFTVPLTAKTGDKLWDLELLGKELKSLGESGGIGPGDTVGLAAAAQAIGAEILDILKGRERTGQLVFTPAGSGD